MNLLIIGNGFDIIHDKKILFNNFVKSPEFKEGIKSYKKYFQDNNYKKFSKNTYLWSKFENYCLYICEKYSINTFYFMKKISKLFTLYWQREETNIFKKNPIPRKNIKKFLKCEKIDFIISFNYTCTPEIYNFRPFHFHKNTLRSDINNPNKWKNCYLKMHDYAYKNIKTIIGHDANEKSRKEKLISDWDEKIKFNPKRTILERIENIVNLKIFSIGFSFGNSDQQVNDFLFRCIKRKVNVTIYTKNEAEKKEISKKFNILKVISKDFSK